MGLYDAIADKRFFYRSAKLKGFYRGYVSIKKYDAADDTYLCVMPYGATRWVSADELESFCL